MIAAILEAFASLWSPTGLQVLLSGLLLGAVYALFSSGLTLIWGMMNVVNFAHGDFVMLGMYVAFVTWKLMGGGPLAAVPLAALALATLGVVCYFALIRDVMRGPMLAQILGTFGLALLLRYSVFWYFGANFQTLPDSLVGGTYEVGPISSPATSAPGTLPKPPSDTVTKATMPSVSPTVGAT